MGLSAAFTFIASNIALATNFTTKDLTTLDVFLLGLTISNYLLTEAIIEQVATSDWLTELLTIHFFKAWVFHVFFHTKYTYTVNFFRQIADW